MTEEVNVGNSMKAFQEAKERIMAKPDRGMVHRCLAKARHSIASMQIKKSGYNSFSKFYYYELDDIFPAVSQAFRENDLIGYFNVDVEKVDEKLMKVSARLEIMCLGDGSLKDFCISFLTSDLGINKGANILQSVGAMNTYLKRYLYMNAIELSENDMTDSGQAGDRAENGVTKAVMKAVEDDECISASIMRASCESDINNILSCHLSRMSDVHKKQLRDRANELSLEWSSDDKRYKRTSF